MADHPTRSHVWPGCARCNFPTANVSEDGTEPRCLQCGGGPRATPDRAATLRRVVQTLRDRDCPYLGHYKLGYDAALDDVLEAMSDE